jgi:hypothetical protein
MFESYRQRSPRFLLGKIFASPDVTCELNKARVDMFDLLHRHQFGDWKELPPEAISRNEQACEDCNDVISVYSLDTGESVWIATDDLRRFTVLVLASERF